MSGGEVSPVALAPVLSGAVGGLEVNVLGDRNPRGIPSMVFIDDVAEFIRTSSTSVEALLGSLQTMHSKYRMMESHLAVNMAEINGKVPEIEKSLEVIRSLQAKMETAETMKTHFNLSDNIYAQAEVTPCDRVCLWLGANVMLEYDYAEADKLLSDNLAGARRKLADFQADLDFVRAACITTEVNMARVFNHDVKLRREAKAKLEG